MARKLKGGTIVFGEAPSVVSAYTVVGKKEGAGPLGRLFDKVCPDASLGEESWEKAESTMQQLAIDGAITKGGLFPENINFIFGGDLLNQCTATAYAVRGSNTPFFGLYGACSTAAEGAILAAMTIDGGFADSVLSIASSHFCSAERQFRFPLEYGGQRTPSAQWTATGAGALLFGVHGAPPYATAALPGRIIDLDVTDINNMGAAMAPAAADTLTRFFNDSGTLPEAYDAIVTGDLGSVGSALLNKLMDANGYPLGNRHYDCGLMLFSPERQDVHSGGSGCGCSAVVMGAYFLPQLAAGDMKRVLFAGTGALMSPVSVWQGESIPGIAHLICYEG